MTSYEKHRDYIESAIRLGIDVEQDWSGPSVKPEDLTKEQIAWLASWLASEGIGKLPS